MHCTHQIGAGTQESIEGNEQADQAAKAAATPSTPTTTMKSEQNRSIQSTAKTNEKLNGKQVEKMQDASGK